VDQNRGRGVEDRDQGTGKPFLITPALRRFSGRDNIPTGIASKNLLEHRLVFLTLLSQGMRSNARYKFPAKSPMTTLK